MSHLITFDIEIVTVVLIWFYNNGDALNYFNAADGVDFIWIICEEFYFFYIVVIEYKGDDFVCSLICCKPELMICLDGIKTSVLKGIGIYLVQKTYVSSLLRR